MSQYYVGLDVHSRQSVFVIEDAAGQVIGQAEVRTTLEGLQQLQTQHRLPAGTPLALETGTIAFFSAPAAAGPGAGRGRCPGGPA